MKLKFLIWVFFFIPFFGFGQSAIRLVWSIDGPEQEKSFSNDQEFKHFADSLIKGFRENGFLQSELKYQANGDTSFYSINNGPRYSWSKLKIDHVPELFLKELGEPGLTYPEPFLWLESILKISENRGYPFASAKLDSIQIEGNKLEGKVVYQSGPLILWDSVSLPSTSKTKQAYLQLFSGLDPGELFSQEDFEHAGLKLRRSKYFSLSRIPELSFQNQSAIPFFPIQERKINVFDGVIGFLPNENEQGKLLVTGQVDLQLYHLGGRGRDISVQWQRLNVESQSLGLAYRESFIFRSKLDFGASFSLLKQDSSFVNRDFEADFGYQVSDFGYLRFFTSRKAGDLLDTNYEYGSGKLPEAIDYRWTQYGIRGEWDSRDDVVFPRKGGVFKINFSVGNKRIMENTGIPEEAYSGLEESSLQMQGGIEGEKHLFLNAHWGMWFRGSAGFLENENLFINEYFRLGGLKTIRGFNEKFFFAKSYGYLSMEQRLFFGENTYLMAFVDFGVIDNPFNSPEKDYPTSIGSGINLDTGGGLFSFVIGMGKSNIQPFSFEYARIHFGYLARF